MRLTCILALAGVFGFGVATVACTEQAAATPSKGGDDDDSSDDDDDDTASTKDGGTSSSSSGGSSSSSGGSPMDAAPPRSTMTFFITSAPAGNGGNLGGLAGADKKCQDLATAVNAGDHKWAAFLGIKGTNPKDRIGKGPWQNQKGVMVAADVASLLDINHQVPDSVFLDEKGAAVPPTGRYILTGSLPDGTPTQNNCNGWTDNTKNAAARFGDTTPSANPNLGANWAFAKGEPLNTGGNSNCTTQSFTNSKSEGRVACFATD